MTVYLFVPSGSGAQEEFQVYSAIELLGGATLGLSPGGGTIPAANLSLAFPAGCVLTRWAIWWRAAGGAGNITFGVRVGGVLRAAAVVAGAGTGLVFSGAIAPAAATVFNEAVRVEAALPQGVASPTDIFVRLSFLRT